MGGAAILFEYQAGLIAAAVGLYAATAGLRSLGRYAAGLVPGVVLLGLYDWAAFGSPFHLSYRYVADQFATEQSKGFFGIHAPRPHAIWLVLGGNRGLFVDAPVLLLAVAGLWLLWRRGLRAESLVCALVSLAFLLLEFGYYDPYGGDSPGPRFLIPALPFLAVGLGPAFARWRTSTCVLALVSVIASTAILESWPKAVNTPGVYHWSVWREVFLAPLHGVSSELAHWAPQSALTGLGSAGSGPRRSCSSPPSLPSGSRFATGASAGPDVGLEPTVGLQHLPRRLLARVVGTVVAPADDERARRGRVAALEHHHR